MAVWKVGTGEFHELIREFLAKGVVAVGWPQMGDVGRFETRDDVLRQARNVYPHLSSIAIGRWTSNLWNFSHEIQTGDGIIAYDPENRVYRVGTVTGPYRHDPSVIGPEYPNVLPVLWEKWPVPGEMFSRKQLSKLKYRRTVFKVDGLERAIRWYLYRVSVRKTSDGSGDVKSAAVRGDSPALSGYGRDDMELGDPLELDHRIAFEAETSVHYSYWRGESKEVYTGRGWDKDPACAGQPHDHLYEGMDGTVFLVRNKTFYNLNLLGHRPDSNLVKVDGIQGNDGTIFVPGQLRQMVTSMGTSPWDNLRSSRKEFTLRGFVLLAGRRCEAMNWCRRSRCSPRIP